MNMLLMLLNPFLCVTIITMKTQINETPFMKWELHLFRTNQISGSMIDLEFTRAPGGKLGIGES